MVENVLQYLKVKQLIKVEVLNLGVVEFYKRFGKIHFKLVKHKYVLNDISDFSMQKNIKHVWPFKNISARIIIHQLRILYLVKSH